MWHDTAYCCVLSSGACSGRIPWCIIGRGHCSCNETWGDRHAEIVCSLRNQCSVAWFCFLGEMSRHRPCRIGYKLFQRNVSYFEHPTSLFHFVILFFLFIDLFSMQYLCYDYELCMLNVSINDLFCYSL